MKATIERRIVNGDLCAPPSKSMTQRAYAGAILHHGTTEIVHPGTSDDEQAALNIIVALGAEIVMQTADKIVISSKGVNPLSDIIDCGESGLSARLFAPIAGLSAKKLTIIGRGSLTKRPMRNFREIMPQLGVSLDHFTGYIPFSLYGPMQAGSFTMDASDSSQFLSGLLFALSACAEEPINIEVIDLASKPYVDLTLLVLKQFGKPVIHDNYQVFHIIPDTFTRPESITIDVEGDWSSAAYLLVAGAIGGSISVRNLNIQSTQADMAILDVLRLANADMDVSENCITVKKSTLRGFEFDATNCPDLFPILAILGACGEGDTYIAGVHRLFYKESNRAESITQMLQDFDVPYSVEDDVLCVTGVEYLQGTIIDSYKDHRIVMAAAVGALNANGPVDISAAESVNKSYPGFFRDIALCGAQCTFD